MSKKLDNKNPLQIKAHKTHTKIKNGNMTPPPKKLKNQQTFKIV